MNKTYQDEWQGIPFSEFFETSSSSIASREFYQAFYVEFFKRYQNWEELAPWWRQEKELWAQFVLDQIDEGAKVLSVGCGLGAMEHFMRSSNPNLDLSIHEVAPSAWGWIASEFPEDHKFLGLIPDCLPKGIAFDFIFLSGIDYALDDDEMVGLLAAIRPFLSDTAQAGRCLLLSGSFEETPVTLTAKLFFLWRAARRFGAMLLDGCGLRPRGQFWGWRRTQREYQALMRRAGFRDIEDGFISPEQRPHYWILGR